MSIELSLLTTRLEGDVPAKNGVPSAAQYTQAVKDAVADFSRRCPMQKVTTLSIVSGTASYTLPADFLSLTRLASLMNPTGVIIADAGLVPVAQNWVEQWTVNGRTLTFYPTPQYSLSRDVWYVAGYVLDATNTYADLTDEDAQIALIKAQALAITMKANVAADDAWRYSVGAESVSKENLVRELREQAAELERQYKEAVEKRIGSLGIRAGLVDYVTGGVY